MQLHGCCSCSLARDISVQMTLIEERVASPEQQWVSIAVAAATGLAVCMCTYIARLFGYTHVRTYVPVSYTHLTLPTIYSV